MEGSDNQSTKNSKRFNLDPVLYIIYTNDVTNDNIVLYIDDISLICSQNTEQTCAIQVAEIVNELED